MKNETYMQIFIVRHGQANAMASSDVSRELTSQGQDEVLKMAQYLKAQSHRFDVIYVSPYVRAQQTANIIAGQINQVDKLATLDLITPAGNANDVHDYIDGLLAQHSYKKILLVSHMPIVSYLVGTLTAGQESPLFQTAAIAKIDYDVEASKGELTSLLAPSSI